MKHAVVVGGTGMLSGSSLWLLDNAYHVSIIARNANRMNRLIEKTSFQSRVTSVLVDYKNSDELKEKVDATIKQNGNIDLVVAWIHSIAKDAFGIITEAVSNNNREWELYHVLGSSSDIDLMKRKIPVPDNCLYHHVQLGFVMEDAHSRWLTHKEISDGVIEAIEQPERIHTIGQIEPWEKRP